MPFRTGSISYARFQVIGTAPPRFEPGLRDFLDDNILKPADIPADSTPETGWVTGHHIYDTDFDEHSIVYGDCLLLAMRMDTHAVPAEIKRAYRALAEARQMEASDGSRLSRAQRQAAREEAEQQLRQEMAQGQYRRSKLVPVLWNLADQVLLAPVFTDAPLTALNELMERTFNLRLRSVTSGVLASELMQSTGRARDVEDAAPTGFSAAPPEADGGSLRPLIPWTQQINEAQDFLGNEFAIWLIHHTARGSAAFDLPGCSVSVFVDRALDLACAWDCTGSMSMQADGPGRAPETRTALQRGKWPRKLGLTLACDGDIFECSFQADRFLVTSLRLPKPDEPFESLRLLTEHRLAQVDHFDAALRGLFRRFLDDRCSARWGAVTRNIRSWIAGTREELPLVETVASDPAPSNGAVPAEPIAAPTA
jgi:hypothetical protein